MGGSRAQLAPVSRMEETWTAAASLPSDEGAEGLPCSLSLQTAYFFLVFLLSCQNPLFAPFLRTRGTFWAACLSGPPLSQSNSFGS